MNTSVKVSSGSLTKGTIYLFLVTGYMNTVLRLAPESDWSLFRILLPPVILFYCYLFTAASIRWGIIIVVFFIYGLISSVFISRFESFNFIYFLHYATITFIGALVFSLIDRFGIDSVYNHLRVIYKVMIALAIFQFISDLEFPNTQYLGTLNIYYWVDNDFSAVLAVFIPFLWFAPTSKVTNKLLAATGLFIIAYNGSRIALLSVFLFLLFSTLHRLKWIGFVLAAIAAVGLFFIFKDYQLGGDSLSALIVDPFSHIITLTPYEAGGSIYDRTNALIFGLTELVSTYFFGIGPGNATAMFELSEYHLPSAQSMHNFIAQVFVEYGWLMLIMIIVAVVNAYNLRRKMGIKKSSDRKLYLFFATAALASLSQSEGLFSNYYFFVCIFASVAFFGNESYMSSQMSNDHVSFKRLPDQQPKNHAQ